jgi:acyl-CoA synthetase (AMP-forming)/AMP-acid ligase II/acyl carrier protein
MLELESGRESLHKTLRELIFEGGHDTESTSLLGVDGEILSYAGLRKQVDYIVRALNSRGFRRGERVALVMPNGFRMAITLLSVMAGFVCAPLDPGYREAELEQRLTGMKAACILTQAGVKTHAPSLAKKMGIELVELEGGGGNFTIKGVERVPETDNVWTSIDDTVLLLHTSGTTAKPKLVGLTNRNVAHSVTVIKDWLGLTSGDRGLGMMPLFHVHGQIMVFASLAAGGSVVCAPGFDPERFFGWLGEFQPTWYSAVPTIHRAVYDTIHPDALPMMKGRLRFIRSASSALPVQLLRGLEDTFKVPVIEAYGMTEASHGITSNPLPPLTRKAGSVGLPFPGEEVTVIGEGGKILGEGEVGEIIIRGKNVITGYLENPEADAKSFWQGWLRTGDLGCMDSDGYLYIKGRVKELINRGGEKISPREVEEALLADGSVSEAVAFPVPHPTLGEDVAAAVVLKGGHSVREGDLREGLLKTLAQHKVPQRIFFVDQIPKTSVGKPKRVGMAERLGIAPASTPAEGKEASAGDIELVGIMEGILSIWKSVLRRNDVTLGERFLEAGGDSLRATQVAARLREAFGVEIDIASLFEADTVAGQARLVKTELAKEGQRRGIRR